MAWNIDASHSHVNFSVRHMMISKARGSFEHFTGTVEFDEQEPSRSTVNVQIDAASINTKDAARDTHLKSPDFFNAEQYPYLTFKSTSVEPIDDTHGHLHGDLTIRDITKPVTLDVEYAGQAKSPWGTTSSGFSAQTKISRKEWNLTWNVGLETGGVLVGDEISIDIELEIVKQPEAEAELAAATA